MPLGSYSDICQLLLKLRMHIGTINIAALCQEETCARAAICFDNRAPSSSSTSPACGGTLRSFVGYISC